MQLDAYDFQLYDTPVVLTLQGDFEDEEFNSFYPGMSSGKGQDQEDEDEDEDGQWVAPPSLLSSF